MREVREEWRRRRLATPGDAVVVCVAEKHQVPSCRAQFRSDEGRIDARQGSALCKSARRFTRLTRFVLITGVTSAALTLYNMVCANWTVRYADGTGAVIHGTGDPSYRRESKQRVGTGEASAVFGRSRFDIPWNVTPRVRLPSLSESRHRVLFSTVSPLGNSGLGHMLAVLNAEVHTAMMLSLTYTHRVGQFGSLTAIHPERVETFFGWGRGEIPRLQVYRSVCGETSNASLHAGSRTHGGGKVRPLRRPCTECGRIANPGVTADARLRGMDIRRLVQVPEAISFSWCNSHDDPQLATSKCTLVRDFRRKHNGTQHALFQIATAVCDEMPAFSDFSQTAGWYYWHYWDAHMYRPGMRARPAHARPALRFSERELSIAVHARRGDFLSAQNADRRSVIAVKTFARAIREVQRIVGESGGPFSRLPTRVYVYSEGRRARGATGIVGHDVSQMTDEFVDVGGVVRNARWVQNAIGGGVRVTMRISTDTVEAMHEMAGADWFLVRGGGREPFCRRCLNLPRALT
jgi:hypothetical protein